MSLIGVVLTLVVVGVLLWLLNNYVPMDAKIADLERGRRHRRHHLAPAGLRSAGLVAEHPHQIAQGIGQGPAGRSISGW